MNTAARLRERFEQRRARRARRRAAKKTNRQQRSSSADSCTDGCIYVDFPGGGCSSGGRPSGGRGDGCDGCDDGCGDGCDLNLMMLTSTSLFALFNMAVGSARPLPRAERRGGVKGLALNRIRAYQLFVSAKTPPRCRMTPTCSAYAVQAIDDRGLLSGLLLTVRRIRSCRPGGPTGHQPVPAR